MDKLKKIITSPLFKAACAGGVGLFLLLENHPLYGGISIGIGIRELLNVFSSENLEN